MNFCSPSAQALSLGEIHVNMIYDELMKLDQITSMTEYEKILPRILENMGRYTQSDRSYFFKRIPHGYQNILEWCRAGISSQKEALQFLPNERLPHWQHAFAQKETVSIWSLADIQNQMPEEYELLQSFQISSLVLLPLFSNSHCLGFVGLDNPNQETYEGAKKFLQVLINHLGFIHENLHGREKLQQQMQDLSKEKHLLDTLCADFSAVYRCDLTMDSCDIVKVANRFQALDFDHLRYSSLIRYMYDYEILPDSFPKFLETFQADHLKKVLSHQQRISYHVKALPNDLGYEHFELQISRLDMEDDHFHILIGIRPIDNLLREKEQLHKKISTATRKAKFRYDVIQSIGKLYKLIYFVDLQKQTLIEISSNQATRHLLDSCETLPEKITKALEAMVSPMHRETMAAFLSLETLNDRIQGKETISQDYMDNNGQWCQGRILVKRRNADGSPATVLYLVRSIDDAKKQEILYQEKLVRTARDANLANQAKSHFLRRMSHDIRTPINGILGTIEVASSCPQDEKRQQICRDQIKKASTTLLEMVNDVLDMNKLESGAVEMEIKSFSIHQLMQEVYHLIDMQAPNYDVTVSLKEFPHSYDAVIGSARFLRRILLNLAGNALKYNRKNGTIILACKELDSQDDRITYQFICEDTGLGMSQEFQQHAFEPFTQESNTARTHYMGTGLGLAIVKELVQKMGGTISLSSKEGIGSRFVLEVPFAISHETVECVEKVRKAISLKGLHILLVEDNELNRDIAKFLLEKEKVDVTCAANGKDALTLFRQSPNGFYQAIFMDIMMPVMGGYEACRQIRHMDRPDAVTIPIFAMTANAFYDDIQKSQEAGMNEHFTKPLNMPQILETLKKYVGK